MNGARQNLAIFMACWHHISLELAESYVRAMTDPEVRWRKKRYEEIAEMELSAGGPKPRAGNPDGDCGGLS